MCSCQKISGMARRKSIRGISANGIQGALMATLPIAGGYIAGEILTKQLTMLASNQNMGNIIKLGAGVVLASSGKGMVSQLGIGLAANGATGFIAPALRNAGIARLLPPGVPSALITGTPLMEAQKEGVLMQ